jgi:hypothetical protein
MIGLVMSFKLKRLTICLIVKHLWVLYPLSILPFFRKKSLFAAESHYFSEIPQRITIFIKKLRLITFFLSKGNSLYPPQYFHLFQNYL